MENNKTPRRKDFDMAERAMSGGCLHIVGGDFISEQQRRASNAMQSTGARIAEMLF